MPAIPTETLRSALRTFKTTHKFNDKQIGELCEPNICQATVSSFFRGSNPQRGTLDAIECLLKNDGMFTRLGLPTEKTAPQVKRTPVDDTMLSAMGILDPRGNTEIEGVQAAWDQLLTIQAIMNGEMDRTIKARIIKQIMPNRFSDL